VHLGQVITIAAVTEIMNVEKPQSFMEFHFIPTNALKLFEHKKIAFLHVNYSFYRPLGFATQGGGTTSPLPQLCSCSGDKPVMAEFMTDDGVII
jgi:hypothetical protein